MATMYSSNLGMTIELLDRSPEILRALDNAIERGLEAIGLSAQEHAIHIITDAPAVQTGLLKNSITFAISGQSPHQTQYTDDNKTTSGSYSGTAPSEGKGMKAVYIGTNVEYAIGIETGSHRKKGAVHFLQRAANDYKDEYRKIIKDSLENA